MLRRLSMFLTAFAAVLCLLSTPSHAQTSRIYFAGYLGLNTSNDQPFSENISSTSGDIEMDNAHVYAGALGFRLSKQFRLETELSYRKTDLDRITFNTGGDFGLGGELRSWLAMANFYYDFDVSWKKVKPFIGAGLGYGWHSGEIEDSSGLAVDASEDMSTLAWQLGGGVRYRVSPNISWTGAYRYLDSLDLEFEGYTWDYGSHEFLIGVEYDLPVRGAR